MSATHHELTNQAAYLLSGFVALSYVGVLYIFPSARSRPWDTDEMGRRLDRLHPVILKARLYAISYTAFSSLLLVGLLLKTTAEHSLTIGETLEKTLILTGIKSKTVEIFSLNYLRLLIQPLILTGILFWGPLYSNFFLEPSRSSSSNSSNSSSGGGRSWKEGIDIYFLRAIVLGPLLEEIVFRGCIIAFHLLVKPLNRLSISRLIFVSPLWFGLAHVHGIWESYITLGRTKQALKIATLQTIVQFTYTTIFGWYAAFIHLRTGSVIAAVLCHSFCNFMGLPPLFDSMSRFPNKRSWIMIHYLVGLLTFTYLIKRWATHPTWFPNSFLWNSLRNHSVVFF